MNISSAVHSVPQVHTNNDAFYWKIIFPLSYKNRNIIPYIHESKLILDGDVYTKENNKLYCNRCNNNITHLVPMMFGSADVGYELVYKCPDCDNMICRIYDNEETNDISST